MMHKTFIFWLIGFSVLALILTNVPLFNVLGYEFSAVLAFVISFVGSFIAITTLKQMKRSPGALSGSAREVVLRCFWRALGINVGLLLAALIIILFNAFRVKNCDISEGLLFFGLLPGVSCIYATAAGLFFGLCFERRWRAYTVYIGYILLTFIPLFINVVFHPPVFAYHDTFGYFAGPIYDEQVTITTPLLIARGCTLLVAFFFLAVSAVNCEMSRETALKPQFNRRNLLQFRAAGQLVVYLLALSTLVVNFNVGALGIRPTRGDIERELGGFHETEHFEIYYATVLEDDIALIAEECEFQYAELASYLGAPLQYKVRAYIYASAAQKKRLIGARYTSVEDPFGHGFHIHAQGFPHPVLKHELAHVFTVPWSPMKVSFKIGLHEGIAVAADWDEGKLTGHQWAKAMHRLEVAPSLSAILGVGFWGHAGARSYVLAGSFVRFLVDTYGIEKFKRVFPFGNFEKYYRVGSEGKDVGVLEREWMDFLKSVPLSDASLAYAKDRLKRQSIFERACAHEIAELRNIAWRAYSRKDFATATKTFERILSFDSIPGFWRRFQRSAVNPREQPFRWDTKNLRDIRGLMFSLYQMKEYERALSLATHLITSENTRFSKEAALLKGDIHWLKDEYEAARKAYVSVSSNVDLQATPLMNYGTLENRAIKRLVALSYPSSSIKVTSDIEVSLRELLRNVLVEFNNPAEKMTWVLVCQEAVPDSWLAYFLAGELLHTEKVWDMSNHYLRQALIRGGEDMGQLVIEARRLTGINAYRLAFQSGASNGAIHYKAAEEAFSEIAMDKTLPLGSVMQAQTWIRRCQWAQRSVEVKGSERAVRLLYKLEEQ